MLRITEYEIHYDGDDADCVCAAVDQWLHLVLWASIRGRIVADKAELIVIADKLESDVLREVSAEWGWDFDVSGLSIDLLTELVH